MPHVTVRYEPGILTADQLQTLGVQLPKWVVEGLSIPESRASFSPEDVCVHLHANGLHDITHGKKLEVHIEFASVVPFNSEFIAGVGAWIGLAIKEYFDGSAPQFYVRLCQVREVISTIL